MPKKGGIPNFIMCHNHLQATYSIEWVSHLPLTGVVGPLSTVSSSMHKKETKKREWKPNFSSAIAKDSVEWASHLPLTGVVGYFKAWWYSLL